MHVDSTHPAAQLVLQTLQSYPKKMISQIQFERNGRINGIMHHSFPPITLKIPLQADNNHMVVHNKTQFIYPKAYKI